MIKYHNKNICQCVQEETDCNGNVDKCNYPIGKITYEFDLKENTVVKKEE